MKYASLVLLCACTSVSVEPFVSTRADSPLEGVNGFVDSADTACHVVLREIAGDVVTLDVSRSAVFEQAAPAVLFLTSDGWHSVDATTNGDLIGRFQRFTATLPEAADELVPYLQLKEGGRLFDHNRDHSAFSTYPGSAFTNDAALCPLEPVDEADAELHFRADGSVERSGVLKPGAVLRVAYDLERLPACRNTHNGFPAWDTVAYVRVQPSGHVLSQSVRVFQTQYGYPTNVAEPSPFLLRVPDDATRLEIWFENKSGAGSTCVTYDSNAGANHVFLVQRPVAWLGNVTVKTSRGDTTPCGSSLPLSNVIYDSWVRQRAAVSNICFDVWQPGVTDVDDADVWQKIDAKLRYRFAGETEWKSVYAGWQAREGNNARYAIPLRPLDPYAFACTGGAQTAELEIEANGVVLSGFSATFSCQ